MTDFRFRHTLSSRPRARSLQLPAPVAPVPFAVQSCLPPGARRPRKKGGLPATAGLKAVTCAAGFTLLELLMVITIMSAVAWMALGNVADNTNQVRYEATNSRLDTIREAIVGSPSQKLWEKGLVASYVADNGRLPENISSLIRIPSNASDVEYFEGFGLLAPVFDPTPASGLDNNNGDEVVLNEDASGNSTDKYRLMKGHRGAYLHGARKEVFRDGWGNVGQTATSSSSCPSSSGASTQSVNDVDDDNFGWCVTLDNSDSGTDLGKYEDMYIDSYGLDGNAGELSGDIYEADAAMAGPISADDWQTSITPGDLISIRNRSGKDIDLTGVRAAMLIFINDGDMDALSSDLGSDLENPDDDINCWMTLTSGSADDLCLEGDGVLDDGDNTTTDCSDTSITETTIALTSSVRVPIGEHILVLVNATGLYTGPDSEYVFAKVKFYPRAGVPEMVLTIR